MNTEICCPIVHVSSRLKSAEIYSIIINKFLSFSLLQVRIDEQFLYKLNHLVSRNTDIYSV